MPALELRLPDGAVAPETADQAIELARIWWIGARPEMTLRPALKDPRNVGRLLAETARHYAQVYASADLGKADELLEQMKAGWDDGMNIPMATHMTKTAGGPATTTKA